MRSRARDCLRESSHRRFPNASTGSPGLRFHRPKKHSAGWSPPTLPGNSWAWRRAWFSGRMDPGSGRTFRPSSLPAWQQPEPHPFLIEALRVALSDPGFAARRGRTDWPCRRVGGKSQREFPFWPRSDRRAAVQSFRIARGSMSQRLRSGTGRKFQSDENTWPGLLPARAVTSCTNLTHENFGHSCCAAMAQYDL